MKKIDSFVFLLFSFCSAGSVFCMDFEPKKIKLYFAKKKDLNEGVTKLSLSVKSKKLGGSLLDFHRLWPLYKEIFVKDRKHLWSGESLEHSFEKVRRDIMINLSFSDDKDELEFQKKFHKISGLLKVSLTCLKGIYGELKKKVSENPKSEQHKNNVKKLKPYFWYFRCAKEELNSAHKFFTDTKSDFFTEIRKFEDIANKWCMYYENSKVVKPEKKNKRLINGMFVKLSEKEYFGDEDDSPKKVSMVEEDRFRKLQEKERRNGNGCMLITLTDDEYYGSKDKVNPTPVVSQNQPKVEDEYDESKFPDFPRQEVVSSDEESEGEFSDNEGEESNDGDNNFDETKFLPEDYVDYVSSQARQLQLVRPVGQIPNEQQPDQPQRQVDNTSFVGKMIRFVDSFLQM